MSNFAEVIADTSVATARARIRETLEANIEDWDPQSGNLDAWIEEAQARLWSLLMTQAGSVGAAAFSGFGQKIANVPPILAAPATVQSTWTAIDTDGHLIEDGTQVAIPNGDEPAGFVVVGDVEIPAGSSATAAGQVLLQAINPGAALNGLSGEPRAITAQTAFVDSIALVGETSGGVDEEDEDAYLDRLTEELQLLSLSLIVPPDFEIDARSWPGVERAVCIPAYNAETKTGGVPLCVTVVPIDEEGKALSESERAALQEHQASKVPSGVLNFVDTATYSTFDIWTQVKVASGFDPAAVKAAVEDRIVEYFSPANWGKPEGSGDPGNSGGWILTPNIYVNEVIAQLDRVPGVDRVVFALLGGAGAGKACTIAAATDVVTTTAAHGFANGDPIVLANLTPGAPLAAATVYYVRDITEKSFKVAATVGGAAINVTSDGSGTAVKLAATDLTLPGTVPLPTLRTSIVAVV